MDPDPETQIRIHTNPDPGSATPGAMRYGTGERIPGLTCVQPYVIHEADRGGENLVAVRALELLLLCTTARPVVALHPPTTSPSSPFPHRRCGTGMTHALRRGRRTHCKVATILLLIKVVVLLLMMLLRGGGGHLVCFGDADAALAQLVQDLAVVLRLPASLPGTAPATTKLVGQNPQGVDPPPLPSSTRSEGR
jgi:hypothetical protein